MMSLFSIFDPSSYFNMNLNFISLTLGFFMLSLPLWIANNKKFLIKHSTLNYLSSEMKMLLSNNNLGKSLFFTSLIMFIVMNNFMGLYPYIFTSTSHLIFTLTLSLPVWLSPIIFGWVTKTMGMLSHLIPPSTSYILMPFMVVVETVSIMIRPFTLAIRLSTNMIAGHLLMALLSDQAYFNSHSVKLMILMIQLLLLLLESGVSIVQSYVFSTLSILYAAESN